MGKRPPPCSKRELYTIWVRDRLLVANVNYIRTKKCARRFLCLMIKIESLGREMVLSRLKHLGVLLVLLQIMKVLVETNEKKQSGKNK